MQTAENIVGSYVEIQDGRYSGDEGLAIREGKDEDHVIVDLKNHGIEEEFKIKDIGILGE